MLEAIDKVRAKSVVPVIVASFPRSGTHLMIDFLRRNFKKCRIPRWPGQYLELSFVDLDRISRFSTWPNTVERTFERLVLAEHPVCKTHSGPSLGFFDETERELVGEILQAAKVIHVVRDPRKVLCSYQLMRQELPARNDDDLLGFLQGADAMYGGESIDSYERHYSEWADYGERNPGKLMRVRYEDLTKNPIFVLDEIARFLGERAIGRKELLPPKLHSKWQRRWIRLTQFSPSSTAVLGRGKGGYERPADWNEVAGSGSKHLLATRLEKLNRDCGYSSSLAGRG
ncbi:sulfotransferase domain-containing protein [Roseibacillus persicicus]|nr:sulfotransferase domain-containing protein [Roseibacillus persicicus]